MSTSGTLTHDQAQQLMQHVAAIALPQLRPAYPAAAAHYGLDLARSAADPYVAAARERGSPFTWVAFSFAGQNVWEIHVGCVLDLPEHRGQVGFHALLPRWPALPQQALTNACRALGASFAEVPRANEVQHNAPPVALADRTTAAQQFADHVVRFYRAAAPLLVTP